MAIGRARGRLIAGAVLVAWVLAGPASAQDASDPIGALLAPPAAGPPPPPTPAEAKPTAPDQSTDEEEAAPQTPTAAVATPPVAPAAPTPPPPPVSATPSAPQPYVATTPRPYTPFPTQPPAPPPPRPQSTRGEPVHIEEADRTPDAPPTSIDLGYEARLRSSFASAQGMQGPLDGRWTLSAAGAGDLYILQLVDTGYGPLEGAWRDVRRAGAIEGSGFLADIQRLGTGLSFRFDPRPGGATATATLSVGADGRWSGELDDGGQRRTVVMRRY
jgi:hypothetical protein